MKTLRQRISGATLFAMCAGSLFFAATEGQAERLRGGDESRPTAVLQVTNTADSGAGSLRQAVSDANNTPAADTINFSIPATDANCTANGVCTITLTGGVIVVQATGGALTVANQTGAERLLISGNNASRIFDGVQDANLTLDGLTITRGISDGSSGVVTNSRGTLTVMNSIFRQNASSFSIIYTVASETRGVLNLINSTVSDNSGIGIVVTNQVGSGGILNVVNSTISGNTATSGNGGGIYFIGRTMTMTNSTISGNTALVGAGLFVGRGGDSQATPVVLTNCTISGNNATSSSGGGTTGGGIEVFQTTLRLRNTIVSGNTASGNPADIKFSGAGNSLGNNLIGTVIGSAQWLASDILNQNAPRLAPLANNGGATQTRALLPDSPAINAGNNCVVTANGCGDGNPAVPTDQRGRGRVGNVDIGAYEFISRSAFDYDGDGRADLSVFRPSNGTWYIARPTGDPAQNFNAVVFGQASDKLVPADYDGDGKTDVAVLRNGVWFLQRSQAGFTGVQFGDSNDIPVPADYDGDGRAELAVFRPSNGTWYVLNLATNQFTATSFGIASDRPVPADYDGDGKTDIAVNRNGIWYIQRSLLGFTGVSFGTADDRTVPADYDGDGKTDIAVFRPSNGSWYLLQSTAGFTAVTFGLGTDVPAPADYDGDGKADLAVVRNGTWYLNRSTQGFTGVAFGTSTDKPIPNAFVR